MRLHQRLIAGDFPNCRKLSDELEVSAKTIQRDIDFMRDRLGHPSQKIKQHADGRIELNLELGSMEEIERWILSWGAHVRVLAPAELKNRILVAATAILSAG